jgi:hypothetical protein
MKTKHPRMPWYIRIELAWLILIGRYNMVGAMVSTYGMREITLRDRRMRRS